VAGAADLAFGLATSVGPVPFSSVDEAVDFVLRSQPRFPTVPVTLDPAASLLAQAVHGLVGLVAADDGSSLVLDGTSLPPDAALELAARIDGAAFDAVRLLGDRVGESLLGPGTASSATPGGAEMQPRSAAIRVPVLGPVTLSCHLRSAGMSEDDAHALATAVVRARSTAVLQELRRSVGSSRRSDPAARLPIAVVLSEPALVGSMHPTHPVLPRQVRAMLDPVVDALDRVGAAEPLLIGVHVPGPCDWPTVVASGVSYLPLPVDPAVTGWASLFGDLLERGGRLCWGAVPVDRPIGSSEAPHWRRLVELWTRLVADGVDPMLLRLRSTFAPADGLARFTPDGSATVMELTAKVAERVGHQTVAARLSLGA